MSNTERYLVETDWLAAHLDDPSLRILDVTGMLTSKLENLAAAEFDKGHIPGALFFDVASATGVLSDRGGKLPWTWPPVDQVAAVMGRFGVSNDTRVILYAASPRDSVDFGPMWCTRAWWILHHHGVDCAILNGGLEKWQAENHPMSTEATSIEKAKFTARDPGPVFVRKHGVLDALANGQSVIDALGADSYEGTSQQSYLPRKGHITGAVNVPSRQLLDPETFIFADLETTRAVFTAAAVDADQPAVTYCGGGIAATLDAFALARLGNENVAVYDDSLMDWAADDSLPMTDPSADRS